MVAQKRKKPAGGGLWPLLIVMTSSGVLSTPARTRTLDPGIKSPLLYQLSYGGDCFR